MPKSTGMFSLTPALSTGGEGDFSIFNRLNHRECLASLPLFNPSAYGKIYARAFAGMLEKKGINPSAYGTFPWKKGRSIEG